MVAAATAGDALRAVGLELEAALTAADPVRTRRLFHRYRSQANRGFNRVDQRLLDLCEQLQKTGEPLDLLLGALR